MGRSDWRFHHVGIATASLDSFVARFADLSDNIVNEFVDPIQGVVGSFIQVGDTQVEVMEPLGDDQTLAPWLTNGNRVYQIAFEVDNLDDELELARNDRIRVVREAQPAVAFGGRRVAFLMPIPGLLVELIEAGAN